MNVNYYECHITIEPVFEQRLEELKLIAKYYGFKPAKLLMQKRKEDKPEHSNKDTFCTRQSTNLEILEDAMKYFLKDLTKRNFKVWRAKIEAVIYDEKFV